MGFLIILLIFSAIHVILHLKIRKVSADENTSKKTILSNVRIGVWVVLGAATVHNAVIVVPVGATYVGNLFGKMSHGYFEEGPHLVNPFMSFKQMSVRRQIVEFQSRQSKPAEDSEDDTKQSPTSNSDDVTAVSANNLPLTIDVTYAFKLNPKYAWWVYQNIGGDEDYFAQLIQQTARNASRNAAAHFTDTEATTTKRDELASMMEENFNALLVAECEEVGLPPQDAKNVFQVLPVQLRKVLPPEKVLNSIAEKAAAEQDLQRQSILTDIAAQEALRRGNEGTGVTNLFANLPKNFTPDEISKVLGALANKERADALLKSVENGNVNSIIFEGGSPQPAVSMPAAR